MRVVVVIDSVLHFESVLDLNQDNNSVLVGMEGESEMRCKAQNAESCSSRRQAAYLPLIL